MAGPLIIAILCFVFTSICGHVVSSVLCPAKITNGHIEAQCRREEGDSCAYDCAENCSKRSRGLYLTCRNGTWNTNTEIFCSCKITEKRESEHYINPGYIIFFGVVGALVLLFCLCGFICTRCRKRKQMARLRSGAQGPIIEQSRQTTQLSTTYGESVTSETVPVSCAENAEQSRIYTLCDTVTSQPTNSRSLVQQATSMNGWSTSQTAPVSRAENEALSRGPTLSNTVASQYTNPCPRGVHFQEVISSNGSGYTDAPPPYSSIIMAEPEINPVPPSYEEAVSHPVMPYSVNS